MSERTARILQIQAEQTSARFWIAAQILAASAERKTEDGQQYLVVPVVAIREQVISTDLGQHFVPANVISAAAPSWNDQPLTINHPPRELAFDDMLTWISEHAVGKLRYARFDPEKKQLTAEAWIKIEAATQAIVDQIEAGETMNVSIGCLSQIAPNVGQFNGRDYQGVMQSMFPNHLALLPNDTGACSLDDGCGLAVAAAAPQQFHAGSRIAAIISKILADKSTDEDTRASLRKRMMVAAGIDAARFKKIEAGEIDMISDQEIGAIANVAQVDPWLVRFAVEEDIRKFVSNSGDSMMAAEKKVKNAAGILQTMLAAAQKIFSTGDKPMNREKMLQSIAAKRKYSADQAKKFAEKVQAMSDCELKDFFAAELAQPEGDPAASPTQPPPAGDPPAAPAAANDDAQPITKGEFRKMFKEAITSEIAPVVTAAITAHSTQDRRAQLVADLKARGAELSDEDAKVTPLTALEAMQKALPPRSFFGASGNGTVAAGGESFADVVMAEAGEGCPEWMKQ